jgi:hypothetical protein
LNSGDTQPKKTMAINRILPGEKLVGSQRVASARLLERYQSASNCRDSYSLAPNDPALCSRRWEIGTCHRTAVEADYTINSRTMGTRHPTLARWAQTASNRSLFGSEPAPSDARPSLQMKLRHSMDRPSAKHIHADARWSTPRRILRMCSGGTRIRFGRNSFL